MGDSNSKEFRHGIKMFKAIFKYKFYNIDIRDVNKLQELIKGSDLIIHTAAQPSHPKSIEIPLEDFSINAFGTLQLLEFARKFADNAVFIFCSTNKVYGEIQINYRWWKRKRDMIMLIEMVSTKHCQ
jgi:nucleoside-diphosphate-sugar epimerase